MKSTSLSSRLGLALATAAYSGYAPIAPGTVGSAVALPLWYGLRRAGVWWAEPAAIVVLFVVGAWSARVAERETGVEDPGIVVIDEVVGMLISLLWLPVTWQVALAGFLFFRAFDILKPYPAGRLEHVPNGWGVMADDAAAGVYAYASVRLLLWLKPEWLT
jgi:phosphatidylglycerophosphatase A